MTGYSEAADRNKEPIRQVLAEWLPSHGQVLEIGSGTGQHALYFARHFPQIHWLTSDLPANHPTIRACIELASLQNLGGPLRLDAAEASWPPLQVQVVYTSNTCHIMAWPDVLGMFRKVSEMLPPGGRFLVYGPFNIDGEFTADSNRDFDASLRRQGVHMGIRDLTVLQAEAANMGLVLQDRRALPANNMFLCWCKE